MKVCLRNNDLLTRGNVFNRIESINRANKSRGAKKNQSIAFIVCGHVCIKYIS